MPFRMLFCSLVTMAAIAVASTAAQASPILSIPSRTMSDDAFLAGMVDAGTEVLIEGRLAGLQDGPPQPVVILLHGANGPKSGSAWNWSQFLNMRGIATLRLDSYTARGIGNVMAEQSNAAQFMPIYDVYRAVEMLGEMPGIDPERIYIMGFSRGGSAALHASLQRFRDAFGPRVGKIAGFFPFYPACNFRLNGDLDVVDAPIRLFHGGADDWTPVAPCREYAERLTAEGRDVVLTEFPDAHHAFDDPTAPALHTDPLWMTSRACLRVERNGTLVNAETGAPFSYEDACVERGPHSQFNGAATDAAQRQVLEILRN